MNRISVLMLFLTTLVSQQVLAESYSWNVKLIGADKVHKKELGSGVKVAVIDGGRIRCSHLEFTKSGGCSNYSISGVNFPTYDRHGTHVATTIAGDKRSDKKYDIDIVGVAPKATILGYNYLGTYTGTNPVNAEDLFISHAYRKGARVVNMSYGPDTKKYPNLFPKGSMFYGWNSERMYSLIPRYKNMVFVRAACNDGVNLLNHNYWSKWKRASNVPYKDLKNLIIVGNINKKKRLHKSSNRPGNGCFRRWVKGRWAKCEEKNKFKYFFVVAAGTNIAAGVSKGDLYYGYSTGTSMAAPHVTGVVALLQGYWPVLKKRAGSVTNIIFRTAQDLGPKGVDAKYGWGLLRADRAMGPLGKKYLKKNNKTYSLSTAKMRLSQGMSVLMQQQLSYFDEYDRDFAMPIETYRMPLLVLLRNEIGKSELGPSSIEVVGFDGGSWSFSSTTNSLGQPELKDIHWQLKFSGTSRTTSIGYGGAPNRFYQPLALSLVPFEGDSTVSGIDPVLGLADGGAYVSNHIDVNNNFSITSAFTSNQDSFGSSKESPATKALMMSFLAKSDDKTWQTNLTATRLIEQGGLLGSNLTGPFGQKSDVGTRALSVGADWAFRNGYTLSGSYTRAYSDTGNKVGEILDIDRYVTSDAMALGLMKENLFNNSDQLYFSISQPLRASSGSAILNYGDRYDENGVLHNKEVDIDLAPSGREIDFQIGYVRNLSKALKLKTFLYHAEDYNHIAANTNSGGMVRVEWEF